MNEGVRTRSNLDALSRAAALGALEAARKA